MACQYVRAAALADLREDEAFPVELQGESILLAKVQEKVYAFHGICTHGLGYLEEGFLDGYEIVCPLHAGSFDIRDGRPVQPPCIEPIRTYPVRIQGSDVYLEVDS